MMSSSTCQILLVLVIGAGSATGNRVFRLGYISGNRDREGQPDFHLPGLRISAAISLAVERVNQGGLLPPGVELGYHVAETHGSEAQSILRTAELWRQNISAFVGPQETCQHEARMASSFNLAMISHFCSQGMASDKKLYRTFARTRPPATFVSKSVASLLLNYNWTKVALFYSTALSSETVAVAASLIDTFRTHRIQIKHSLKWEELIHFGWDEFEFLEDWLEETRHEVRIYIVLGQSDAHLAILDTMHRLGMVGPASDLHHSTAGEEYFVVGVNTEVWDFSAPNKYLRGYLERPDKEATRPIVEAMKHYLGIMTSPPIESSLWSFRNFSDQVKQVMASPNASPFNDLLDQANLKYLKLRREAAYLYDAVILYAWSLNKTIVEDLGDPLNGTLIIQQLKNRTYLSAMGYFVYMDENGDAQGNYSLVSLCNIQDWKGSGNHSHRFGPGFQGNSTTPTTTPGFFAAQESRPWTQRAQQQLKGYGLCPIGNFKISASDGSRGLRSKGSEGVEATMSDLPLLELHGSVKWPHSGIPLDAPTCGFQGELCLPDYAACEIIMGVVGGVVVVLSVVIILAYRSYKYEQELDSLLWKIDPTDLVMNSDLDLEQAGMTSSAIMRLAVQNSILKSQVSLNSTSAEATEIKFSSSAVHTQIGLYKGRICAVKTCCRSKAVDINRKIKKELKAMRDLRHDNLNSFIGACVESQRFRIVSDYCTRGSLRDVLANDDVTLDTMFVSSLIMDLVRGMIYLHDSPIGFHANLKMSNCLVDSRWVLKVSDFGFQMFKQDQPWVGEALDFACKKHLEDISGTVEGDNFQYLLESLLYSAPELLRLSRFADLMAFTTKSLQMSDVYSFAIILFEIHSRNGPFGLSHQLQPFQIIMKLRATLSVGPIRPKVEELDNCQDFVKGCMVDAWHEDPNLRPDFKVLRTRLRPLRKGMRTNIFDNMLAMMEKYANNLEALVGERTQLLIEEKQKTDALLHEMLPRPVADQLKQGKQVAAEHFDNVTIFFSDIVGFTTMSAESSPMQVVDFLNDLYTYFDATLELFDVYKVETIGDAYMVVSGLPSTPKGILKDSHNLHSVHHAAEIASFALQLLHSVKHFRIRHRPNDTLMLRIGIHSGPVCAGVVGRKMPRYCLFGDTVNTASRMESMGGPLKIHCSQSCHDHLNALGGYFLERRGQIEIKGKGELTTYWLLGEDPIKRTQRSMARIVYMAETRHRGSKAMSMGRGQVLNLSSRNSLASCPNYHCAMANSAQFQLNQDHHLHQHLTVSFGRDGVEGCHRKSSSVSVSTLDLGQHFSIFKSPEAAFLRRSSSRRSYGVDAIALDLCSSRIARASLSCQDDGLEDRCKLLEEAGDKEFAISHLRTPASSLKAPSERNRSGTATSEKDRQMKGVCCQDRCHCGNCDRSKGSCTNSSACLYTQSLDDSPLLSQYHRDCESCV